MPKDALLRFVVGPNGMLVPDIDRKLPGRGVWVTATRASIDISIRRNLFQRATRRSVSLTDDLPGDIETLLARRAMGALSLARKAGEAVAGFEKVRQAIDKKDVLALITARDAPAHANRKLLQKMRRKGYEGTSADPVPVNQFTATQLGVAFGIENVVHAGILDGGAGRAFIGAVRRYGQYVGVNETC